MSAKTYIPKYSVFLDSVNGLEDFEPRINNLVIYLDNCYEVAGWADLTKEEVKQKTENLRMVTHEDVDNIRNELLRWGFCLKTDLK